MQAKSGSDEIGIVQARQDLAVCAAKFSGFIARGVAAQFMAGGLIALFELGLQDAEMVVLREQHYRLVPAADITDRDRAFYRVAVGSD